MQGPAKVFLKLLWLLGANFASSPGRVLIDFMDPLIVAEKVATTDRNKLVTARDISILLQNCNTIVILENNFK